MVKTAVSQLVVNGMKTEQQSYSTTSRKNTAVRQPHSKTSLVFLQRLAVLLKNLRELRILYVKEVCFSLNYQLHADFSLFFFNVTK